MDQGYSGQQAAEPLEPAQALLLGPQRDSGQQALEPKQSALAAQTCCSGCAVGPQALTGAVGPSPLQAARPAGCWEGACLRV